MGELLWLAVWDGVGQDFSDLAELRQVMQIVVRLLIAAILGGAIGVEREKQGKAAGLRTCMLVSLGAALFVVVPQQAGVPDADLSRVVQGVITGVGFLGAGAILKVSDEGEIRGLTTAASIWITAAIGLAAGMGRIWSALLGTGLALIILSLLPPLERWLGGDHHPRKNGGST